MVESSGQLLTSLDSKPPPLPNIYSIGIQSETLRLRTKLSRQAWFHAAKEVWIQRHGITCPICYNYYYNGAGFS